MHLNGGSSEHCHFDSSCVHHANAMAQQLGELKQHGLRETNILFSLE